MRESDIEKYFVDIFERAGYLVRKVKWIGRRGAPDRVVIGHGHNQPVCVFVELKRPGKKLEAHQEREHKRMKGHGAYVFVIDSKLEADKLLRMLDGPGW